MPAGSHNYYGDAEDQNWLRNKARAWALQVVDLHNMSVPSDIEPKKQALLSRAKTIKNVIEKAGGAVPELAPINDLGFVPIIISGVVVAGVAAAATKWVLDYKTLVAQVNERAKLVSMGVSPSAAFEMVASGSAPISANIKTSIKWGAAGIGLFLLAKFFKVI